MEKELCGCRPQLPMELSRVGHTTEEDVLASDMVWFVKPGLHSSVLLLAHSGMTACTVTPQIASPRVRPLSEPGKCGILGQTQRSSRAALLLMEEPCLGGCPGMLRVRVMTTRTKFQVNL